MNEPEMPGRIIAQIATAPPPKNTSSDGSSMRPDRSPSRANTTTAVTRTTPTREASTPSSNSRNATTTEPATRPRKSPDSRTGWASSRCSSPLASSPMAARMPTPRGTRKRHCTSRASATAPGQVQPDQPTERGRPGAHLRDEAFVDPEHQGDGAARHARHDVRRPHEEPADEGGERVRWRGVVEGRVEDPLGAVAGRNGRGRGRGVGHGAAR